MGNGWGGGGDFYGIERYQALGIPRESVGLLFGIKC